MIIANTFFVPKGYVAIALYPFIFVKNKKLKQDGILINHEQIHLVQQLELGLVFFYLWYGIEFLIKLLTYRSWTLAYSAISFEREASCNEADKNYLKTRKAWRFLKYLKNV